MHCSSLGCAGQRTAAGRVCERCPDIGEQHEHRHSGHVRVVGEERGQPGRTAAHRRGRRASWIDAQRPLSVASKHILLCARRAGVLV